MHLLLAGLGFAVVTVGQSTPKPQVTPGTPPTQNPTGGSIAPVRFGSNGWPVGVGNATRSLAPIGESKPRAGGRAANTEATGSPVSAPAKPAGAGGSSNASMQDSQGMGGEPRASGMQLDSYMHDVFRATGSPGALKAIGGVEVVWSLSVHGTHGEIIGTRLITHIANCTYAERDRLDAPQIATSACYSGTRPARLLLELAAFLDPASQGSKLFLGHLLLVFGRHVVLVVQRKLTHR